MNEFGLTTDANFLLLNSINTSIGKLLFFTFFTAEKKYIGIQLETRLETNLSKRSRDEEKMRIQNNLTV